MEPKRCATGVLTLLALLTAGVLYAADVNIDYNHRVDFSQFKTYMWIKKPHLKDPLMNQRVIRAVESQLNAKGLQEVDENADLGLAANGSTQERQTLNTFYDGFGGGWGWGGWGDDMAMSQTTPQTYEVGTLMVDLFDAKTKKVVWRGTATDTLSSKPEKNAEKINKATEKMFKDFPPKEKK